MSLSPPHIFISYSHDSTEHEDRVLALCDRLRADGVDANIDRYESSPPQGWPLWMESQISEADFVLVVCTKTYMRRAMHKEEPNVGHGVMWEMRLFATIFILTEWRAPNLFPCYLTGLPPTTFRCRSGGLVATILIEITTGYTGCLRTSRS
jgi:TIR domain